MRTIDKLEAKLDEIRAIVKEAEENGEILGAFCVTAVKDGYEYLTGGRVVGTSGALVCAVESALRDPQNARVVRDASAKLLKYVTEERPELLKKSKPNSTRS